MFSSIIDTKSGSLVWIKTHRVEQRVVTTALCVTNVFVRKNNKDNNAFTDWLYFVGLNVSSKWAPFGRLPSILTTLPVSVSFLTLFFWNYVENCVDLCLETIFWGQISSVFAHWLIYVTPPTNIGWMLWSAAFKSRFSTFRYNESGFWVRYCHHALRPPRRQF